MADLPTPQSYEQILSDMLSAYATKLGIDDFNVGSVNTSFFEVVALVTARASGDVFQILRDFSVDRATGDALKRLAQEDGVTPLTAKAATGLVSVIDISFTKIFTKVYAGANPPNIGSTAIKVSDASLFPGTGSVYIGRGTLNIEGPLPYTSIAPSGGFFIINLTSPTTKFHNLGETVILAQGGNRTVPINAIVLSPSVGSSSDIQYTVTASAIILDGETEVDNVQVGAQTPGSSGNVPAGAIKSFATSPFSGATVTNPLPFTTGSDSETDDQLRVRIKRALASQGLGTATAVESALIGATPSDENATIVSDSIVTNTNGSATVYIDDGSGYEAKSTGVGLEAIVDSALGGEQFFTLQTGGRQAPVAKAFLQTTLSSPFDLIGGDTLAVIVGGVTYQHVFANADFRSPGGATAFEITASINADTLLGFEATTAGGGIYVVIRSKTEGNDSLKTSTPTTSGRDAAIQMGFPSNTIETLRLYKNNTPLNKDGATASVFTQAQQLWSPTISNGDTLILSVDDTSPITFTILDADFIATGLYTSVSPTNSLASWVQVLNAKLTGVTATVVGQQIEITSNLGANNRAEVVIDPSSTLVTKGMFASSLGLSSDGKASDFTLDRNTAQFELTTPLAVGDKLSAGSAQTEATITSAQISGGSITFASDAHLWLLIDSLGQIIPTGVVGNTVLSVSKPSSNIVRYGSSITGAFSNVQVGDYIIIWSQELSSSNRLEGRIHAVTSTTVDILVTAAEYAAAVITPGITFIDGFVVLRSNFVPQKFRVQSGTKTLDQISQELQSQTNSLVFSVFDEQFLVIKTITKDLTGNLLIVTADTQAKLMNFPVGKFDVSKDSLIAFYDSGDYEAELPLFVHSSISADTFANPIDSYISSFNSAINFSSRDPNELIVLLHPYGSISDAQAFGESVQETSLSGTTIGVAQQPDIRRLRISDRYFIANPLDFGSHDTIVTVLDNDTSNKSFEIPLYRRGITNTSYVSNPTNFNAYDVDSGVNANFSSAFGATFDFSNFKVLMQAKKVLKPTPSQTAILYRATKWGRSGEKINVGYIYPSTPNSAIGSTINVGSTIPIRITLASGAASSNSIDASTRWNVTVTPNTPSAGIDQVSYTWAGQYTFTVTSANATAGAIYSNNGQFFSVNTTISGGTTLVTTGLGSSPTASGTLTKFSGTGDATITFSSFSFIGFGTNPGLSLSGGEYVNISEQSGFSEANKGIFRVSTQAGFTPTSTQFYVQRPTGVAVTESNKSTGVNGAISFYASSPTTAAAIQAYVAANLGDYITVTLVNDGGMTGSGVIVLSTFEDSGFTFDSVSLLDGINWILSSNLSGSPQFIFKKSLSLPTDIGYAFNDGEEVRIIPTTIDQVRRFISILAVSGFSTIGNINEVDRANRLELSTGILGSLGAIQIIGGLGNEYSTPILDSAIRLDNTYMEVSTDKVSGQGIHSDQWFRLQAFVAQKKIAGLSSNTNVSIVGNSPIGGESTVSLSGRVLTQRYFGKSRSNIVLTGLTFRVEKQGSLVCVSWTGSGSSPIYLATNVNFNDGGGGTVNITKVSGSNDAQYFIASGAATFNGLSIGDIVNTAGLTPSANNGSFLVTGISDDGKTIQVFNSNAVAASGVSFVSGNFTAISDVREGDTVIMGSPFAALNQGTFRVIRRFNDSFWIENSNAIEEERILTSTSIKFYEYDAVVPGDKFVITGNILGPSNAGTYTIISASNIGGGHYNDTVVVSAILTSIGSTSLNGFETAVFVQEGIPYYGYKHVFLSSAQPGAPTRNAFVIDTNNQYEKINGSADVSMTSLGKLNFSTLVKNGLDSYRFNTGLIAEANRIIYGDPRDPITYPGVGAAGADLFVREPLTRRIQVSIDVRILTGVPFAQTSDQVRTSVGSLVNSNPVGQPISISSIISAVNAIPGVRAVAIDSPQYDSTHDLIFIAPSEKARIIDPTVDISVSQIGS